MRRLFDIPRNTRVRITSKQITWIDQRLVKTVGENVTWEGTTTNQYRFYRGALRRLLIKPSFQFHRQFGIWPRDCLCEEVEDKAD